MKTGVVDVGGGLRGIYAAGVFDTCLERDIRFDLCVGVSAGSANITSYMAGQKGRNHQFFAEYPFRKEYMSLRNFLRKRSYVDLDYVYGTLSNADGENPVDSPREIVKRKIHPKLLGGFSFWNSGRILLAAKDAAGLIPLNNYRKTVKNY